MNADLSASLSDQRHRQSGFTLVELAVSLIIIALLIGGLTMPLSAQMDLRDANETRRQLEDAKEALLGFAVVNGYLPCPASKISNGVSVACGSTTDGILPWADLGLPRTDSWGRYIRYRVSQNFANPNTITLTTLQGTATPSMTIRSYDSSGNVFPITTNGTVVAVLLSHGKNGFFGTTDNGVTLADTSPANSDEQTNDASISAIGASSTTYFYQRTPSNDQSGTNTEFDDLVTWIPLNTLSSRLVVARKVSSN